MVSSSLKVRSLSLHLVVAIVLASCTLLSHTGLKREENPWRVLWAQNLDPAYDSGNLPIGLGAPAVYQHLLFMGQSDGLMRAYELSSGRVIWQAQEEGKYLGAPGAVFQDALIYGSTEGRVYSRHYLTGQLNWSIDLGASVEMAPTFFKGRALFHLRNHKVVCLDASSGKILWAYKRSVAYTTTIQRASRPLALDDKIVVGMADGFVIALNPDDGSLIWETLLTHSNKFVDVDTDPLLIDGLVMAGPLTGPLSLLDPKSGQVRRTLNYRVSRAPLVDENYIYLGTLDGEVVKLKRQTLDELFRIKLTSRAMSAISWWQGKIAVATTKGELFLLNNSDLSTVSTYNLGSNFSAIFGEMITQGDYLAAYSSRNRLYVFHSN